MATEERLARLEAQVEGHSREFLELRESIRHLEGRFETRFTNMEQRFERFEERGDARFASFERRMDTRFDALESRFASISKVQTAMFVVLLTGAAGIIATLIAR
ncbi:MAG: hypothetical protein HY657_05380 [Acidobacteria bacterium]|nr:hypothetical protein [Acidobacteriota bacterium]